MKGSRTAQGQAGMRPLRAWLDNRVVGLVAGLALAAVMTGMAIEARAETPGGPYVVMLGAPGAGKSTASAYVSDTTGVPVIDVGQMLRDELVAAAGTAYAGRPGSQRSAARAARRRAIEDAKERLEAGLLVDDRAIDGAVAVGVMSPAASRGFVLDGYPGSLDQAQFLDSLLAAKGVEPIVIYLEVPDEVALDRMKGRGGATDKFGIPEQRLEMFRKHVQAVLEYYEDAGLYRVDATQSIPEVLRQVAEVIGKQ